MSEPAQLTCAVCGAPNGSGAGACTRCGAQISGPAPARTAGVDYSQFQLAMPPSSEPDLDEVETNLPPAVIAPGPEGELSEEMPEWLRRLSQQQKEASALEEEGADLDESNMPAWLLTLRESPPAEGAPAASEEEPTDSGRGTPPPDGQEPEQQEQPPSPPIEIAAPPEHGEQPEAEASPAAEAEMPAWLSALSAADVEDTEEGEGFELPEWLKAFRERWAEETAERSEPISGESAKEPRREEPAAAPAVISEPVSEREKPAESAKTASVEPVAARPETGDREAAGLLTALLPSAGDASNALAQLEAVVETGGPLAGVGGALPAAEAMTQSRSLALVVAGKPAARSSGGRIFEAVLAGEREATAAAAPATGQGHANRVIYILILLAAVGAFLLPPNVAGMGVMTSYETPTVGFYDQLSGLEKGSSVLAAFDYETGQAVEMDPAANVILGDLARRNIDVVAISTTAVGARLAQTALLEAAAKNPTWLPGQNFVNVGYLAGGEKGLKSLAESWLPPARLDFTHLPVSASPLTSRVGSLRDFALVIEFSGSEDNLRWWMEQVQPSGQVPILAVVSAAVDAPARNYVQSRQLAGLLRGMTGAAELEWLLKQTGPTLRTVDAQSFVLVLVVLLLIAGNVSFLVRQFNTRLPTAAAS